jgi:hypothetical protein
MISRSRPGSAFRPKVGRGASILLIALATAQAAWAAPADAMVTQGRLQALLRSRPAAGYFTLQTAAACLWSFPEPARPTASC